MAFEVKYIKKYVKSGKEVRAVFRAKDQLEAEKQYDYLLTVTKEFPAKDADTGEYWYVK
jgi:hypothetical protein